MPITVNYQPRAAIAGKVAELAGQGQFQQKRDVFARGIDEFDATLAENQRKTDAANRLAYDRLGAQQANKQQEALFKQQALQTAQADKEYSRDLQQRQEHAAFQEKGMDNLDAIASQTIGAMGKLDLDEQGDKIRSKLGREYQAIQRRRMTMTPDTYRQVLDQWADKVESHNILEGAYDKPQVTAGDEANKRRFKQGDVDMYFDHQNNPQLWPVPDPIKAPDESKKLDREFKREQQKETERVNKVTEKENRIQAIKDNANSLVAASELRDPENPLARNLAFAQAIQEDDAIRATLDAKEPKAVEPKTTPEKAATPEEEFPNPGQRFDNPIEIQSIDEVPEGKPGWYSDGEYLYLVREDGTRIQKKISN